MVKEKKEKLIDVYKISKKVLEDIKEEKEHKKRMFQIEHPKVYAAKEAVGKALGAIAKGIPKKVMNRRILKSSPRATYVIGESPRSTSFQKAWNRESLLGWK